MMLKTKKILKMNYYSGSNTRQVGGGIIGNGIRGIRPFLMSLISKIKPHAVNAAKTLGNQAMQSAANVSSDLAANLVTGRLTRNSAKEIFKNEAKRASTDLVNTYKRKLGMQHGSGAKRRKMTRKPPKRRAPKRRAPKRKVPKRKVAKRRVLKRKSSINKRKYIRKDIFSK